LATTQRHGRGRSPLLSPAAPSRSLTVLWPYRGAIANRCLGPLCVRRFEQLLRYLAAAAPEPVPQRRPPLIPGARKTRVQRRPPANLTTRTRPRARSKRVPGRVTNRISISSNPHACEMASTSPGNYVLAKFPPRRRLMPALCVRLRSTGPRPPPGTRRTNPNAT